MKLKFESCYNVYETLGKGFFGTVMRCSHKQTGEEYAVKIIAKGSNFNSIKNEAEILQKLQHPNVVRLIEIFDRSDYLYLVFELVVGGELMHDIVKRKFYSEADGSSCMQQILDAINYCHKMDIAHCDLKPENILLVSRERGAAIKISDFGLAQKVREQSLRGGGGDIYYMAPEVYKDENYGKPVDMWACGVILYILLIGESPFPSQDYDALKIEVISGVYDYPPDEYHPISPDAKDIIERMLTVDSYKRITASKALKHPWIRQRDQVAPRTHLGETIVRLKKFNARRKFKGAIFAAVAAQKFFKKKPQDEVVEGDRYRKAVNTRREITPNNEMSAKQEIIKLTKVLADACDARDTRIIGELCDPLLTTFDSTFGRIIQGMLVYPDFRSVTKYCNTVILNPYVHLLGYGTAYIAYVRYTEYIGRSRRGSGVMCVQEAEETLVWHKRGGRWRNIHFHRGRTENYEDVA